MSVGVWVWMTIQKWCIRHVNVFPNHCSLIRRKHFSLTTSTNVVFNPIAILNLHSWLLQKCKKFIHEHEQKTDRNNRAFNIYLQQFWWVYVCVCVCSLCFNLAWFGLVLIRFDVMCSKHTCQFNVIMKASRFRPIKKFNLHIKMMSNTHSTSKCNVYPIVHTFSQNIHEPIWKESQNQNWIFW